MSEKGIQKRKIQSGFWKAVKGVLNFLSSKMFIFFALIALQALFFVVLLRFFEEQSDLIRILLSIGGFLLVLWIVNKDQNPAYKIGWIILILILPVLGMTMYFFFSQRKLSKSGRAEAEKITIQAGELLSTDIEARNSLWEESKYAVRQSDYLDGLMFPLHKNTQTKYHPMGEDFYRDLLVELEKAEHFIYMEYFIVQEGVMWNSVLEILERKAAQGVDVRFLYDDIGCMRLLPGGYCKTMRAKGIRCYKVNSLRPVLDSLFNNRDHRKITVIDGVVGFCGGANLADEYINAKERFGVWKDANVMLKGSAVWTLLMMFLQMWFLASGEEVDFKPYLQYRDQYADVHGMGYVQPFADSPLDDDYAGESVFFNMISRAKDYVYINTPYLVVGHELMTALKVAASSGVDVRITVPHIPDKKTVFMLTQSYYRPLIRAGVKIYEYLPGFIHSKTIVSDDAIGFVGTINLDFRSMYLNFECGVWMYGTQCIDDMKRDYLDTVAISKEITYEEAMREPWFKRFFQMIMRIFGPLL